MKQVYFIIVIIGLLLSGCNSENAPECFRAAGDEVVYDIPVTEFSAIHISPGIELVIKQEAVQKVTVHTGANLKEFITAEVKDGTLFITNSNNCNWTRDYNSTTVYVSTPVLSRIYSASQFAVKSDGVLAYPVLALQSGLTSETASGTFKLDVDVQQLSIEDNQSCYYNITGNTEELSVSFYSGDARFNGINLIAQKVWVFHRSSNDVIVTPQQEVKGTLYSTGNLILKNRPPLVEVERLYTGRLIYN